ncbi:MAG: lipoyl(octanoyl) transferase LipB [Elusimicrobia bacterium]|nr:lipoyl(octanoyl) transferase LipB [Elusimicrobiota bacterium]
MLIRALGLKDYVETWDLQRKLVFERGENLIPDTALLCQHPPVYTIGRSSKQAVPEGLPHPVHAVERGGDMTWHGPGQLVGYPILRLSERGLGARSYLSALEAVLAEAIRPFGIEAAAVRGFTGLWVGRRKLASIGVAVRRGISYHGFALNINNDLAGFRRIHPCRLESDAMTSMAQVLGRPVDERAATEAVGRALLDYFGNLDKSRRRSHTPDIQGVGRGHEPRKCRQADGSLDE